MKPRISRGFSILLLFLLLAASVAQAQTRVRIMAGNLSSGNNQSYDPGEGIRIFQGLKPDIVMIQEFNYGTNSTTDIRSFVNTAFGSTFSYYRESASGLQIPNGVISRYPILNSGRWVDNSVSNRGFAWALIDVPGPKNLLAVSVHLLTTGSTQRNTEATQLVGLINSNLAAGDYLVIGGDFNTDSRTESCITTFSQVVVTASPYPADQSNDADTNASRSKPYDWLVVNSGLKDLQTAVVIGSNSHTNGLVFDSRVYTPLSAVSPVVSTDSGATNMQHMGVVKDFIFPADATPTPSPTASITPTATVTATASRTPTPTTSPSPSPSLSPTPSATASLTPTPTKSPTPTPPPSPAPSISPTPAAYNGWVLSMAR